MKTSLLLLFIALGAGRLSAQSFNPTVRTNTSPFTSEYHLVTPAQSPYEMRSGRVVYDGLAIELFEARNPVKLLVPYKQDQQSQPIPTAADRVWEQGKSDRTGLNIFSIKF
jgi:hypothetical protein